MELSRKKYNLHNMIWILLQVGGLEQFFFRILGIILPIDFHIFQDGYCTTNQITLLWLRLVKGKILLDKKNENVVTRGF